MNIFNLIIYWDIYFFNACSDLLNQFQILKIIMAE